MSLAAVCGGPGLGQLMAAVQAEARLSGQFGAASRTHGQGAAAGHAEPRAFWVFRFTTGTVNAHPFKQVRQLRLVRILR